MNLQVPTNIYLFKVNNRNIWPRDKYCRQYPRIRNDIQKKGHGKQDIKKLPKEKSSFRWFVTFAVGGENSRFEKFGDDHNKILGRKEKGKKSDKIYRQMIVPINWSVPSRVVGEQKDICQFDMEIMWWSSRTGHKYKIGCLPIKVWTFFSGLFYI